MINETGKKFSLKVVLGLLILVFMHRLFGKMIIP